MAFSNWMRALRWQHRRPQALGEMDGDGRILVGPRPRVLIHSDIAIEPQRGRRQLGRADLIADPTFLKGPPLAHDIANDLDQAEAHERAALRQPNVTFHPYTVQVAILGRKGETFEALDAIAELRRLRPGFAHVDAIDEWHFGDRAIMTPRFMDQFATDVRNAGLPV